MRRVIVLCSFAIVVASTSVARADDTSDARDLFKKGAELAKDSQWSAALASFEKSQKLKPHAYTIYNIAICERALGQYVRARRTFVKALGADTELPASTREEITKFQAEIDKLVATLEVVVSPADAAIAIDGQALEEVKRDGKIPVTALVSGIAKTIPAARFEVLLDPGHHVFVLSREGFSDAVHAEDVRPGESRAIDLALDRLPATLRVSADRDAAVVAVDGLDVGTAPVMLLRPAGTHRVIVRKPGYVTYQFDAAVKPGQRSDVVAALREEKPSILTRWWFWTAASVVVTGAAVTTYALTRPAAERPALDGGGLGWTVRAP